MSAYTVTVSDPLNLIDQTLEEALYAAAIYVAEHLGEYIAWQGIMDLEIRIAEHSASPYPDVDGILPSLGSITWSNGAWRNNTLSEALTGIDEFPDQPDIGTTIFLSSDGTIRNYGMPIWIDPNPQKNLTPEIPDGSFDFIGVLIHEIFHGLGLNAATQEWQRLISLESGVEFFTGERVIALYGGPLPIGNTGGDHYGNTHYADNRVTSGLMFQWGNYLGNRLDIGRIDLAILEDLGYSIITYENLPLFDVLDSDAKVYDSAYTNEIFGDYQSNQIVASFNDEPDLIDGGSGIDTVIFPSNSTDFSLTKSTIDTSIDSDGRSLTTWIFNSDTLINVERVEFNDKKIALDIEGHAGAIAKLLGAFLGANGIANTDYVRIGLELLDDGVSYDNLLQMALSSVFGETSSASDLIRTFYENLTRQTAPQEIVSTYSLLIETGSLTATSLAAQVIDHPLNIENINLVGLSLTGLEYA